MENVEAGLEEDGGVSLEKDEKSGISGGADGCCCRCCSFLGDKDGEVGISGTEGNDLGGEPGLSFGGGGKANLEFVVYSSS